jgi:hypothetical protein
MWLILCQPGFKSRHLSIREQAERAGSTMYEGDGLSEMRDNNPRRGIFT